MNKERVQVSDTTMSRKEIKPVTKKNYKVKTF